MLKVPTVDPKYNKYIGTTCVHPIYGEYTITELTDTELYASSTTSHVYCKIKFKYTGFECRVRLSSAINLKVEDPYYPTIAGVGYIGEPNVSYDIKEYYIWNGMIDRCYNPNDKSYSNYGAKGVTVDPRWHCFANFVEDFPELPGYDKYRNADDTSKFNIDKDIRQPGVKHKVYSKDTCMLIYNDHNTRESRVRYRETHADEMGSQYFGVVVSKEGVITSTITIQGKYYYLGKYDNEIAAANVYNYVAKACLNNPVLNDAPYMDIQEAISHSTSAKPIEFPPEVDTTGWNIPYVRHSKFHGVKKKRNNFYGLYHNENGSQHIGIFDDEIAAASAHNIWTRLYGDKNFNHKMNKESDDFHEMSLAEVLMHKTFTKETQPNIMVADIDKENEELIWYTKYMRKEKYPGVKAITDAFVVEFDLNGSKYSCGNYRTREAALSVWNILRRYFNMPYNPDDITMTFEQAMERRIYTRQCVWPPEFNPENWQNHLPFYPNGLNTPYSPPDYNPPAQVAFGYPIYPQYQQYYQYPQPMMRQPTPMPPMNNAASMCMLTNESEESRRQRCLETYGVEFL